MDELEKYVNVITGVVRKPEFLSLPQKGMSKVLDHLYLGNYDDAVDLPELSKAGITHIINTVQETHSCSTGPDFYGNGIKYIGFSADDVDDYPIMQHFEDVFDFIEDARRNRGVCLIHCQAGVNRSGVLAVGYVMVHLGIGPVSAVRKVLTARGSLLYNDGFIVQLVQLAKTKNLLEKDKQEINV